MALPPPPKEEVKELAWTGASGGALTKEELEEGVTPPLMSPLAAAATGGGGEGGGGGGQGLQGLDPRHLLHLLTRKVGNYSPPPTTILIKLSLLHNSVFREFSKTSQPTMLANPKNHPFEFFSFSSSQQA